jgi:hypothetical protein
LLTLPLIIIYLFLEWRLSPSPPSANNYLIRLALFLIGCSADWSFAKLGMIDFSSDNRVLPSWLIIMWLLFSATFYNCFSWLKNKSIMAALLGSVFGPLAYWGASRLSTVEILSPITFTLSSVLFWGFTFVYFNYLNKQD